MVNESKERENRRTIFCQKETFCSIFSLTLITKLLPDGTCFHDKAAEQLQGPAAKMLGFPLGEPFLPGHCAHLSGRSRQGLSFYPDTVSPFSEEAVEGQR